MFTLIEKRYERIVGEFKSTEEIYNYLMNLEDGWKREDEFYAIKDGNFQNDYEIIYCNFSSDVMLKSR